MHWMDEVSTNTQSTDLSCPVSFSDIGNEYGYNVLSCLSAPDVARVTMLSVATCATFQCSIGRRWMECITFTDYATSTVILRLPRPQTQTSAADALATIWSVSSYRINLRFDEDGNVTCRLAPEGEICHQTLNRLFPNFRMEDTGYNLYSDLTACEFRVAHHNGHDVAHHLGRVLGYIREGQVSKPLVYRLSDKKLVVWDDMFKRFDYPTPINLVSRSDWELLAWYGFDAEKTFRDPPILTKHGFPKELLQTIPERLIPIDL